MFDCVGDLYLSGRPLIAHVEAHRSGHELNNAVLRELFSSENNWSLELAGLDLEQWDKVPAAAQA